MTEWLRNLDSHRTHKLGAIPGMEKVVEFIINKLWWGWEMHGLSPGVILRDRHPVAIRYRKQMAMDLHKAFGIKGRAHQREVVSRSDYPIARPLPEVLVGELLGVKRIYFQREERYAGADST